MQTCTIRSEYAELLNTWKSPANPWKNREKSSISTFDTLYQKGIYTVYTVDECSMWIKCANRELINVYITKCQVSIFRAELFLSRSLRTILEKFFFQSSLLSSPLPQWIMENIALLKIAYNEKSIQARRKSSCATQHTNCFQNIFHIYHILVRNFLVHDAVLLIKLEFS